LVNARALFPLLGAQVSKWVGLVIGAELGRNPAR
jgi:hypothetical protein